MNDRYFWFGIAVILVACTMGMCMMSCNSTKPITRPDNTTTIEQPVENLGIANTNLTDNTSTQVTNNVWPWMILAIVQPVLFLAYLYFSKNYSLFGRR